MHTHARITHTSTTFTVARHYFRHYPMAHTISIHAITYYPDRVRAPLHALAHSQGCIEHFFKVAILEDAAVPLHVQDVLALHHQHASLLGDELGLLRHQLLPVRQNARHVEQSHRGELEGPLVARAQHIKGRALEDLFGITVPAVPSQHLLDGARAPNAGQHGQQLQVRAHVGLWSEPLGEAEVAVDVAVRAGVDVVPGQAHQLAELLPGSGRAEPHQHQLHPPGLQLGRGVVLDLLRQFP
mmetsp:Transcript_161/g.456  ORF Transcript_161/g.456 Transcript_161/m.456 type:complete len:241 (+) Transcript_161:54-776(+)